MRVLVCPTAFKGTLSAAEATAAMAAGVGRALPEAELVELPLSDGGPGLLDALRTGEAGGAEEADGMEEVVVTGPLGEPVTARILWTSGAAAGEAGCAVLESADACGLHLVPEGGEEPLRAHTRGVGELIQAAVARGAGGIVVGLGGSATSDGGTGMARVFGYRFLDDEGRELPPGGGELRRLAAIAEGVRPPVRVTALADVESPLNGLAGAARRFGPQKGATAEQVDRLVEGLERLGARLAEDLGAGEVADRPGSGAAGGLGAGLAAFLGAGIEPGAEWVLDRVGFAEALAAADLVVTGEGTFDASSEAGKVVGTVLERAREAGVPALLLCGALEGEAPGGVRAADGGGERLDADGLADLAEREAVAAAG